MATTWCLWHSYHTVESPTHWTFQLSCPTGRHVALRLSVFPAITECLLLKYKDKRKTLELEGGGWGSSRERDKGPSAEKGAAEKGEQLEVARGPVGERRPVKWEASRPLYMGGRAGSWGPPFQGQRLVLIRPLGSPVIRPGCQTRPWSSLTQHLQFHGDGTAETTAGANAQT